MRSDKEFAESLKEVDAKFWHTIEYEKNLYSINRSVIDEGSQWPSKET